MWSRNEFGSFFTGKFDPEVAQKNRDARHGIFGTSKEREAEHKRRREAQRLYNEAQERERKRRRDD